MTAPSPTRTVLTCTCEGTMAPDGGALARAGCGGGASAHQLCRADLDRFRAALAGGLPVTVACTQEAPLFREVAEAETPDLPLAFANIRETAGWTAEAGASGPKMAALIAAAEIAPSSFGVATLESQGVALILGSDETALTVARDLADSLDITVLLIPGSVVTPPRRTEFPVLQGLVRQAKGHLGAFEVTVDAYAAPAPSSRQALTFGPGRDGAVSRADLVIDLTGRPSLFSAGELRPGYVRADPRDPVSVAAATVKAGRMVGAFDKPVFIDFAADLCAHSRNRIVGCTRCLSLCPTGAIAPAGDSVAIDPMVCAGCGQCAAVCPTGAASYALPDVGTLAARLRAGLRAYHDAGGRVAPVVLFHDADHGEALIDASARFGAGLPAHVVPVGVSEISQTGPETLAAALAYGAGGVALLGRAKPKHDLAGLHATLDLMDGIADATGHGPVRLIETDDPDAMEAALAALPRVPVRESRASFLPPADKRGLLVLAFAEMNRAAPTPAATVALGPGAPFGTVLLDIEACTLCHACTGVCPTGALVDNPEVPMLRFTESACVQCGLCAATCPEDAIGLAPRLDFPAWDTPRRILREEEPFRCTKCAKPFATRSGIERVQARLTDHWMFTGVAGAARLDMLTLCEDCRVEAAVNAGFDPHGPAERKVRTAEDYRPPRDDDTIN
ncbi:MAG: 4Fe-4S dicluster domain-containing protein [Inquilinaceae bacterium]